MKMPPQLYKFQRFSAQSEANLQSHHLWLSKPLDFNDPFDCAIRIDRVDVTDDEIRTIFEHYRANSGLPEALFDAKYLEDGKPNDVLRREIERGCDGAAEDIANNNTKGRGVCCFCESRDQTLMWSHYADYHKGFCLEFDTQFEPFSKARNVTYADDFPAFSVVDLLLSRAKVDYLSLMFTKATCWSYEREWRVHDMADKAYSYPPESLKAVYLGVSMLPANKDKIQSILHGTTTELYEIVREKRSFRLQAKKRHCS